MPRAECPGTGATTADERTDAKETTVAARRAGSRRPRGGGSAGRPPITDRRETVRRIPRRVPERGGPRLAEAHTARERARGLAWSRGEAPANRRRRAPRRRAPVSSNDLASGQTKPPPRPRETRPDPPRRSARANPVRTEERASLPPAPKNASSTAGRPGAKRQRRRDPGAATRPASAPATCAISEPDFEPPPALSGARLAFARASGAMPPPPPPPQAPLEPAARARGELRRAEAPLDESRISPAENEAVKRECLHRVLEMTRA